MSHNKQYCVDIFNYNRFKTSEVKIGELVLGNDHPIAVQSMTTTNTNDTDATVSQIKSICDAGAKMVRMTTQGQREAHNLEHIKSALLKDGYTQPLVADIHYNPSAASIAATHIEKVRINPGNFVDGAKKFEEIEYTNESYYEELEQVRKKLVPLLNICKENNTAIRIGTNHGSLSDRIMSRYGDTPMGMVESCMEFLRICKSEDFNNVVLSIKASNARVMVHTVRLLVQKMADENMNYPLHLGVTEAGEGEDGRIRSAVGIGTLLVDGIGDTIRVSLTENPENEIPVANDIINYTLEKQNHQEIKAVDSSSYNPFKYVKRVSHKVMGVGANQVPVVVGKGGLGNEKPDLVFGINEASKDKDCPLILPYQVWHSEKYKKDVFPMLTLEEFVACNNIDAEAIFVKLVYTQLTSDVAKKLASHLNVILVLDSHNMHSVAEQRAAFLWLQNYELSHPVIIYKKYTGVFNEHVQIKTSCDFGPLLLDGFGDGIWVDTDDEKNSSLVTDTMFAVLQASRVRFSKPDYISCPGCGRTLFGLQETTAKVKQKTAHLKGLKIAVMGCIVNGPGEMADADYGYVGSGPGKITLYHQREVIKRNIEEKDAVGELIELIKQNGDWVEP
ncbi:(E)-4-hydroxy-3-methylbut-2-enyl-diphosphate synthase [Labilibacter sediminis]|nr:(E)-4-hydroxy-3-methylbut-2-enyl-diphosphate synthase [Labilibacter sediminis]